MIVRPFVALVLWFACTSIFADCAQAQALEAIAVPWQGNPNASHTAINGAQITLQGVAIVPAGCNLTSATWDPGDGTGPVALPVGNPRVLELDHTYNGLTAQPFVARLTVTDSCGNMATDTTRVRIADDTLGARVDIAIDTGLWELHKNMILSSVGGVPTGSWSSGSRAAATASAALAFQIHGHSESADPAENPYADNVARAIAHLMTELRPINIGPQSAGDPDLNGNGIGLRTNESPEVYIIGQVVDAITATGTPNKLAQTGGTNVIGETYLAIVEDMMEAYYWGQTESGSARGGWQYSLNNGADNSACQWAAIGALGAVRNFGVTVPQWVKGENRMWLDVSQATNGQYGYTSSGSCVDISCMNTTPSGLVQLIMDDVDQTDPDWVAAEGYMLSNFGQLTGSNRIYGMFSTAKAMRLALPTPISLLGGSFDWYGHPTQGLAQYLVATQQTDAGWNGGRWVSGDLATAWAVIVLSPTILCAPPIAVCDADPQITGPNIDITFDGTQSIPSPAGGTIVDWEWDFDGDGVPDAFGPIVTRSFPTFGVKTITLRVRDDQNPPCEDTDDCLITIVPPPFPPNADPGGPYNFCLETTQQLILDGTNSSDPDGTIQEYAWDFSPQPLNLDFNDAFGPTVNVTNFFTALGPGVWDVALRVTDDLNVTNIDFTTVTVYAAGQCPPGPAIACESGGRNPGSVLVYPVHRSGPGFFTIVSVTNTNNAPATPVSRGGATGLHFEYVNSVRNPADPFSPLSCVVFDRHEYLTASDTLSVLTSCHNATAPGGQDGYLVISAEDPNRFATAWAHDHLIGSEIVISPSGYVYSLNAFPICAGVAPGNPTDVNANGRLDFDDVEYGSLPERLFIQSFVALAGSQLALINFTGNPTDQNTVMFSVWNDNEYPLSATLVFSCWFDQPLEAISPLFTEAFLSGTFHDPRELDVSCDGVGDLETGWAIIDSIDVTGGGMSFAADGAMLGSITAGPGTALGNGDLLWESEERQANGAFFGR